MLDRRDDIFWKLSHANDFETLSLCDMPIRQGATLVTLKDEDALSSIPIVRTTTSHKIPSQRFRAVHSGIIEEIKRRCESDSVYIHFNNAMAEIYDSRYTKMGFHSDLSLDLAPDSYICIYSCYEDEREPNPRRLITKDKTTGETSEIAMEHNSAIIFSTSTNEKYLHKIVTGSNVTQSKWLGVTFRLSKTFIRYLDGTPYIDDQTVLTLATEQERNEFLRHKSLENKRVGYRYPEIHYTLNTFT